MLVNIKIVWQKKPKKKTLFGVWNVTTTTEKLAEIRKLGNDAKKVLQYLAEHKLINENKKELKLKAQKVTIDLSESYAHHGEQKCLKKLLERPQWSQCSYALQVAECRKHQNQKQKRG